MDIIDDGVMTVEELEIIVRRLNERLNHMERTLRGLLGDDAILRDVGSQVSAGVWNWNVPVSTTNHDVVRGRD